jgi:hypothetical protein
VTERQWYPEDTDDTATQRLPRVEPPLPGALDPTRRPSTPYQAPAVEADATAELSIDDLMGPSRPVAAAPPVAVPPPPPPQPAVARPASPPPVPPVAQRVRGDAAAAWSSGVRRSRTWLDQGDNAVIAATAFVTVLLLVMIAVL